MKYVYYNKSWIPDPWINYDDFQVFIQKEVLESFEGGVEPE